MFDDGGKIAIRNCPPPFRFTCEKSWEGLEPTDQEGVRHCDSCNENVHLCETDAAMLDHARQGHCVAKYMPVPGIPWGMFVGRPKHPSDPQTIAAETEYWREQNKSISLRYMHEAESDCPVCGFPQNDRIQGKENQCLICEPPVFLNSGTIEASPETETEQ